MEQLTAGEMHIEAQNIGGIDETSVDLSPGVNTLVGRNATNRTSFLQALMAVCGSRDVSLKSDADEGHVEMEFGGETYTRTITRVGDDLQFGGDPYLDDTTVPDLFAFLLESNEARRAVVRGDDLRDIIMRPVDIDEINAEIERLEDDKRRLDQQLDDLDDLEDRLPELEEKRRRLDSRLEAKQAELEDKQAAIDAADADVDESRQEKSRLEAKLGDLKETQSDLEDVRFELETQRERLSSLESEQDDLEAELSEMSETPAGDLTEIEREIDDLRQRKRRMENDVSELQNVIQFNESRLEDDDSDAIAALEEETDSRGSVTDQLLEDGTTTCWTCGSTVETDQIEETVDRLRELSQRKLRDVNDIESELEELQSEKRTLERQQEKRTRFERELERTADQIEDARTTIAELEEKKVSLTETVEGLEADVTDLESTEYEEILEIHREANQLEFEIDQLQSEIEEVADERERIERSLDEREDLQTEREELQSELTDLRTRIDRLEESAVEAFNENMATVLELLDYENIDRIWIERVERSVREGRRTVQKMVFDLHIVRSSESGAAYEDTVETLSESEREVTGLVFALAGYLTHDIYETCPLMLLDSLEAIDSDRIARLVEYFANEVPYFVVALLPEDAAGLSEGHQRIEQL